MTAPFCPTMAGSDSPAKSAANSISRMTSLPSILLMKKVARSPFIEATSLLSLDSGFPAKDRRLQPHH